MTSQSDKHLSLEEMYVKYFGEPKAPEVDSDYSLEQPLPTKYVLSTTSDGTSVEPRDWEDSQGAKLERTSTAV